jgi:hypothetical protein
MSNEITTLQAHYERKVRNKNYYMVAPNTLKRQWFAELKQAYDVLYANHSLRQVLSEGAEEIYLDFATGVYVKPTDTWEDTLIAKAVAIFNKHSAMYESEPNYYCLADREQQGQWYAELSDAYNTIATFYAEDKLADYAFEIYATFGDGKDVGYYLDPHIYGAVLNIKHCVATDNTSTWQHNGVSYSIMIMPTKVVNGWVNAYYLKCGELVSNSFGGYIVDANGWRSGVSYSLGFVDIITKFTTQMEARHANVK